jgi:hypothetical protein
VRSAILVAVAGIVFGAAVAALVPPLAARLTRGADLVVDRAMNDHALRRVVTAHDLDGASIAQSDAQAPHRERFGDLTYVEIWRTGSSPAPLTLGPAPDPTLGPLTLSQPGGSVFRIVDYLPAREGGKRTPMHRTSTIDYCILMQGELVLVLEGSEISLKAGDVVVQRGTNHAWENRSDKPARMAFVMLDATFGDDLKKKLPRMQIAN